MSDLISRKALIKELNELWRYVNFDGDKDVFDIIMKAKAIEQGEPVGWLNNVGFYINNGIKQIRVFRGEPDANDFNIPVFTTPQQPQSIADALEDLIWVLDEIGAKLQCNVDSLEYIQGVGAMVGEAEEAIRALIKRNAEGVESDDLKDAKRYRWLREVSRDPDADKPHCVITKEVLEKGKPARMVSYLKFDEALDAEIDRAIAVKEGE